jgi:hypothetical protein
MMVPYVLELDLSTKLPSGEGFPESLKTQLKRVA